MRTSHSRTRVGKMLAAWLAVGVVAGALGTACGGSEEPADDAAPSPAGDPVVIGAAVAQTGWMNLYDMPAMNALKLAIEDQNAKGGVDGRPIKLIIEDTRTDLARAQSAAQELLEKDAEIMIVSCGYDQSAPAALVAERAEVLSFSICSSSPKSGVQGIGPLHYTAAQGTPILGAIAADWPYHEKEWKNAYILLDDTDEYNITMCGYFEETAARLDGMKIVGRDRFQQTDTSISAQISRLKTLRDQVDFIVLCSYPPGGATALRQLRAAGIDTPIVTNNTFDGESILETLPNLSDVYFPAYSFMYGDNEDPQHTKFWKRYADTYGGLPPGSLTIVGYTTGEAIFRALEMTNGSTDGKQLAAKLNSFDHVPLLAGDTTFSEEVHIELQRPMTMLQIDNGKFVQLGRYLPEYVPDPFD